MIFDAIRESHDLQRDLCRKLTSSRGEPAARELLFLQLKVELMAHAAADERALYVPLLMTDAGLDASRHALHISATKRRHTNLVRAADSRLDRPGRRGEASAGAKLRGRSKPRRTR